MSFSSRVVRVAECTVDECPALQADRGKERRRCRCRPTGLPKLVPGVFLALPLDAAAASTAEECRLIESSARW